MSDRRHCCGCRDDFYNEPGNGGKCWSRDAARVVTRWRQDWNTCGDVPGAFVEVKTHDCHHEPGRFAFLENLPSFAVAPVRLAKRAPKEKR